MIEFESGNLLKADVEALVNTVNTVGAAGKGIALQFRQAFPENFKRYAQAAKRGEIRPGRMFVFPTGRMTNPRFIINFPTKRHWRGRARIQDIEAGLQGLIQILKEYQIKSVAIPPLGCGNGGLEWSEVKPLIVRALDSVPDVRALLFEPKGAPSRDEMPVATKRPRMTLVRALVLIALDRYNEPGYRASMLEVQKLAYLLQVSGAPLRLQFAKHIYGPYAEVLHQVLQAMEGHYIRGYGDRSDGASIRLLPGAVEEARSVARQVAEAGAQLDRVTRLIEGFETPYGLELLATVLWVARNGPDVAFNPDAIVDGVQTWSPRKKARFRPEHIVRAWERLRDQGWLDSIPEPTRV